MANDDQRRCPPLDAIVSFVTLMLLMDNFRVFEPIISFKPKRMASRSAPLFKAT